MLCTIGVLREGAYENKPSILLNTGAYIYYWFEVDEGTLQIHHLNSDFTPNPKNKLLKIVHKLITVRQKRQPHNQSL
jgi:hypothetical protein